MSDTKTPGDKTLHAPQKTLSIKPRVEQGTVRQSFSHGRTKQVVVERKRSVRAPGEASAKETATAPAAAPKPAAPAPQKARPGAPTRPGAMVLRSLSESERDARAAALVDARRREEEERSRREAEERRRQEEERARVAAEAKARAEEEERRRAEAEEARRRSEAEAAAKSETAKSESAKPETVAEAAPAQPASAAPSTGEAPAAQAAAAARPARPVAREGRPAASTRVGLPHQTVPRGDSRRPPSLDSMARPAPEPEPEKKPVEAKAAEPARPASARPEGAPAARGRPAAAPAEEEAPRARKGAVKAPPVPKPTKGADDRRRGRLTVTKALAGDEERTRSVASFKRRMQRLQGKGQAETREKISREVIIPETITIQELANRMAERAVDVIRLLMKQGEMHKITDVIDADTAQIVAEEMGHAVKRVAESDVEEGLFAEADVLEDQVSRPPVVTIMGHVDHGKTSLLDAIRKTNVVSGEAGGITQHIGAYQVTSPSGGKVTFIDTPGHAAFTAMRARGAKVTDIVVLVVAADDGVMPQTVEAISHAKAAGVPMIVAINKIDKPSANPQRVRTELLQHDVQVESMGGETLEFEVSALTGAGLDELLEGLQLQSEILDLKANPDRAAEGTVVEAKLDRGRGPVATVLVQRGTLRTGDIVVAGAEWGRVRALVSDVGDQVKEAGPSVPVEVLGFNGTPEAGDRVAVVENEARAREITEYRTRQKRERLAARTGSATRSLADMMRDLREGAGRKEMPLVVKGDVQGSVEAIIGALEKIGNDEVAARVIHAGVGGITESDVTLAEASGAVVLGFNVRAHKEAREASERAGVEVRYYNIIYDLVDDIKAVMSGMLPPQLREERLGEAQILEVFNVSKVGKVAGCRVLDGVVQKGAHVRLIRDNVVIHEGKLSQLKRFKDDAREVLAGQECGMAFENYQDMRKGDVIECYRVEEIRRTL
ncbi:translation initiation factor IF-2 [Salinarimonas sp.]|uniref:translation initiation factor IF-2 n=1 Tax=Salinarimonas sp. TaxID=2766526 RepID=UPI00391D8D62